ncbi:MAG: hypothetical protein HKN26_05360 [Acidimicrobiales bacterium]|nr:hypothetical protein [Acidimicrobiales bacterium]
MRIVLHIGTESAGSAALQRSLHLDVEALRAAGVYVPTAGRPVPHVAKIALGWITPKLDTWEELAKELANVDSDVHTIVMSHESIWSQGKKPLLRLRGLVGSADLSLVMYLRDQADYLSWRVLEAQRHPTKRFDFNDKAQMDSFIRRMELDYLAAAQRLESVFGRESLDIIPENDDAQRDLDLVTDFYKRLGVGELAPDTTQLRTITMLTPGLADALRFAPGTAPYGVAKADLLDIAMRLSSQGIGARQVLKPDQVGRIRHRYQVSNGQLSQRYLDGRPATVARPYTNLADHRSPDELRELLLNHVERAPLLKADWLANPTPTQSPFSRGWVLREASPTISPPLVARLHGDVGRLRFRVPFGFEERAGQSGVELLVVPDTPGLHPCRVRVNGRDRGIVDIGATKSIPLGQDASGLGVFTVDLAPTTADPLELAGLEIGDRPWIPERWEPGMSDGNPA